MSLHISVTRTAGFPRPPLLSAEARGGGGGPTTCSGEKAGKGLVTRSGSVFPPRGSPEGTPGSLVCLRTVIPGRVYLGGCVLLCWGGAVLVPAGSPTVSPPPLARCQLCRSQHPHLAIRNVPRPFKIAPPWSPALCLQSSGPRPLPACVPHFGKGTRKRGRGAGTQGSLGGNTGVGCHFLPRDRTRVSCVSCVGRQLLDP